MNESSNGRNGNPLGVAASFAEMLKGLLRPMLSAILPVLAAKAAGYLEQKLAPRSADPSPSLDPPVKVETPPPAIAEPVKPPALPPIDPSLWKK